MIDEIKDSPSLVKDNLRRILKPYLKRLSKLKQAWGPRIETLLENPYIHPFIFPIYPILFLYYYNITELLPRVLFFPIMASILMSILLLGLFYLLYKNKHKSTLITSFILIVFISFSEISSIFIERYHIIPSSKDLLKVYIFLLVVIILFLKKISKTPKPITQFANVVAIILFSFTLFNIVSYEIRIRAKFKSENKTIKNNEGQQNQKNVDKPDIYYIILDAYGREDTLNESYNYDNIEFLEYLKEKGFYVASKSSSNYSYSHLSIPSTFNFKYLDYLTKELGTVRKVFDPALVNLFHQNEVGLFLKSQGYQFINYDSGWWFTQTVPIADVNVRQGKIFSLFGETLKLNYFYQVLLRKTALSPYIQETLTDQAREQILSNFAEITEIPYQRGKKFVIAHFVLPHPPWLFDENGGPVLEEKPDGFDKRLYINQLRFTNKIVQETIDKILSRSTEKPIIIIASDHGPLIPGLSGGKNLKPPPDKMVRERMRILNAYYFPNGGRDLLYDSITPVNTFRILFNYYFGTNYELLEDRNYFSWTNALYEFYDVTDQIIDRE